MDDDRDRSEAHLGVIDPRDPPTLRNGASVGTTAWRLLRRLGSTAAPGLRPFGLVSRLEALLRRFDVRQGQQAAPWDFATDAPEPVGLRLESWSDDAKSDAAGSRETWGRRPGTRQNTPIDSSPRTGPPARPVLTPPAVKPRVIAEAALTKAGTSEASAAKEPQGAPDPRPHRAVVRPTGPGEPDARTSQDTPGPGTLVALATSDPQRTSSKAETRLPDAGGSGKLGVTRPAVSPTGRTDSDRLEPPSDRPGRLPPTDPKAGAGQVARETPRPVRPEPTVRSFVPHATVGWTPGPGSPPNAGSAPHESESALAAVQTPSHMKKGSPALGRRADSMGTRPLSISPSGPGRAALASSGALLPDALLQRVLLAFEGTGFPGTDLPRTGLAAAKPMGISPVRVSPIARPRYVPGMTYRTVVASPTVNIVPQPSDATRTDSTRPKSRPKGVPSVAATPAVVGPLADSARRERSTPAVTTSAVTPPTVAPGQSSPSAARVESPVAHVFVARKPATAGSVTLSLFTPPTAGLQPEAPGVLHIGPEGTPTFAVSTRTPGVDRPYQPVPPAPQQMFPGAADIPMALLSAGAGSTPESVDRIEHVAARPLGEGSLVLPTLRRRADRQAFEGQTVALHHAAQANAETGPTAKPQKRADREIGAVGEIGPGRKTGSTSMTGAYRTLLVPHAPHLDVVESSDDWTAAQVGRRSLKAQGPRAWDPRRATPEATISQGPGTLTSTAMGTEIWRPDRRAFVTPSVGSEQPGHRLAVLTAASGEGGAFATPETYARFDTSHTFLTLHDEGPGQVPGPGPARSLSNATTIRKGAPDHFAATFATRFTTTRGSSAETVPGDRRTGADRATGLRPDARRSVSRRHGPAAMDSPPRAFAAAVYGSDSARGTDLPVAGTVGRRTERDATPASASATMRILSAAAAPGHAEALPGIPQPSSVTWTFPATGGSTAGAGLSPQAAAGPVYRDSWPLVSTSLAAVSMTAQLAAKETGEPETPKAQGSDANESGETGGTVDLDSLAEEMATRILRRLKRDKERRGAHGW